jgi:uncharacterized protein YeaO (DUF488 family)
MIRVERVYDHKERDGGARFLVDRLWPRGIRKEALQIDGWLRDVAPSDALRRWFDHDPAKWEEFKKRYFQELDEEPAAWQPLLEAGRSRPGTQPGCCSQGLPGVQAARYVVQSGGRSSCSSWTVQA